MYNNTRYGVGWTYIQILLFTEILFTPSMQCVYCRFATPSLAHTTSDTHAAINLVPGLKKGEPGYEANTAAICTHLRYITHSSMLYFKSHDFKSL